MVARDAHNPYHQNALRIDLVVAVVIRTLYQDRGEQLGKVTYAHGKGICQLFAFAALEDMTLFLACIRSAREEEATCDESCGGPESCEETASGSEDPCVRCAFNREGTI